MKDIYICKSINQSINQSPAVLVPLLKLKLAMYMCCCCNRNATVAIASAVLYWKPLFAQHDVHMLQLRMCMMYEYFYYTAAC